MYGNQQNYGGSGGYTDEYGNQYSDSYGNQYGGGQYGSGGNYATGSYGGHQSRSPACSPTSPTELLPTSNSSKRPGYGSPVPRRNNSPGVQISIPTGQGRGYRSTSPGRQSANINSDSYGRYTNQGLSPGRNVNVNPLSGVETPTLMRPSSVRIANARTPSPTIPGSPSRMGGMRHGNYGGSSPGYGNSQLTQFFNSVDTDHSGRISWDELQQALRNGDWTEFNERTCRLMISMFDNDWSGTIDCNGFSSLWTYINDWHSMFDSFDNDASGTIDCRELNQAFLTFGYNIPSHFAQTVISIYDKTGRGGIKFDSFIEACCLLKLCTGRFDERDPQRTKRIQINLEQFIEILLDTCLLNI